MDGNKSAPAPPEQFAPHNLLARHAMVRADANQDGWLTLERCFESRVLE
jgi:hypothetical protein